MAIRRVILAKTRTFSKGKVHGAGTDMTRYLKNYMDGVGKALVKHGEYPHKSDHREEKRHLLESETRGILIKGGFLGHGEKSPGHPQRNKQLGWIKRFSRQWTTELEKRSNRTNDGFRFVLSMAPRAVADLTESGKSPHQALVQIWEKTIELYREQHGWDDPKNELGWVMGAHDDTDNFHFHIILFPTTKDGANLKTHNNGKKRGQDLNNLTAMANIASEIFWREQLGLEFQDPDYRKAISVVPTHEVPLPSYDDFEKGRAITEPKDEKREKGLKINTKLIAKELVASALIGINTGSPIRKPKRKGLSRLKSLVCAVLGFENLNRVKRRLISAPEIAIANTSREFTLEAEIVSRLAETLKTSIHKPTQKLGESILGGNVETNHAILSLVLGNISDPDEATSYTEGVKLAAAYQKLADQPEPAIAALAPMKNIFRRKSIDTKVLTQRFRNALKWLLIHPEANDEGEIKNAMELLEKLILGSERLGQLADSTIEEIAAATKLGPDKNAVINVGENDWNIVKGKMIRKKAESLPWPLHFDPASVFVPMEQPEPAKPVSPLAELDEDQFMWTIRRRIKDESKGVLRRIVRFIQPKETERRRLQREMIEKAKETKEADEDTPDL